MINALLIDHYEFQKLVSLPDNAPPPEICIPVLHKFAAGQMLEGQLIEPPKLMYRVFLRGERLQGGLWEYREAYN